MTSPDVAARSAAEGTVLGEVRKPARGWNQRSASDLNHLVRKLATNYGWQRLVVRMHPSAWSQVAMHLNYNLSFPVPGVPMDCAGYDDVERIVVVLRG